MNSIFRLGRPSGGTTKAAYKRGVTLGICESWGAIPFQSGGYVREINGKAVCSPIWTLEEGIWMVRQLQILALQYNLHLALAGGVLNNGASQKDLDIVVMGLKADKPYKHDGFLDSIKELGWAIHACVPQEYQDNPNLVIVRASSFERPPIDFFLYDYGVQEGK